MIITFKSWNETGPNGHRKRCFAAIDSSSSLAEPDRPSGSGQMSADVYDVWCVDLRILRALLVVSSSPSKPGPKDWVHSMHLFGPTVCIHESWILKTHFLTILIYDFFNVFGFFGPFCVCIHAYELCSHYQYISHDITCIQLCSYSFSCLSWECQSECRQGWVSPWASAGGLAAGNAMAVPGRPPVIAPRDGEKNRSFHPHCATVLHSQLFNWQWLYTFHSLFSHSFLRFQEI